MHSHSSQATEQPQAGVYCAGQHANIDAERMHLHWSAPTALETATQGQTGRHRHTELTKTLALQRTHPATTYSANVLRVAFRLAFFLHSTSPALSNTPACVHSNRTEATPNTRQPWQTICRSNMRLGSITWAGQSPAGCVAAG